MKKLYELSQEYMLNGIEQIIRHKIIDKSKLLMLTEDMELAIPLFILADELRCEEAVNNCLIFMSEKLNIYADYRRRNKNENWKFLIEEKTLRAKTRLKLLGLFLEKKRNNLRKEDGNSGTNIDELKVIAQELINFDI